MAQDTPDWQKLVIPTNELVVGQDVPDWQRLVKEVSVDQAGQDWPDWQRVIVVSGSQWDGYVSSTGPSYWWKMAEATGSTAADSADTNPGAYVPALGSITLGEPSLIPNTSDTCPLFEPNSDMLAADSDFTFPSGDFSQVIVFRSTTSPGVAQGLCGLYIPSSPFGTECSMYLDTNGYLFGGTDDGAGAYNQISGTTNLMDDKAHMAGFTWMVAGRTVTVYEDGVSLGSRSLAGTINYGTQRPIAGFATAGDQGARSGDYWSFTGELQSYIIWDKLLTSTDMFALFAASGL